MKKNFNKDVTFSYTINPKGNWNHKYKSIPGVFTKPIVNTKIDQDIFVWKHDEILELITAYHIADVKSIEMIEAGEAGEVKNAETTFLDKVIKHLIQLQSTQLNTQQEVNNMGFKEINPGFWAYENDGDSIVGELVQIQHDVGENKSSMYSIQTEKDGLQNVWGSAVLDSRMSFAKVGNIVRITYKGLGEKKPGKNAAKIFKVEIDQA